MPKYEAGSIEWVLDVLDQNANKTLDLFNKRIDILEKKMISTDKVVNTTKKSFLSFESVIKSVGGAIAGAFAFDAIVGGIRSTVTEFVDFEKEMRRANTIMGLTQAQFKATSDEIVAISKEVPFTASELANALFDVASAGVSAENQLAFLAQASKFAAAGTTDLNTAISGLTAVTKGFSLAEDEAVKVTNLFFQANKDGQTTIEEMSNAIQRMSSAAVKAGVSIEETFAFFSTFTGVVGSAAEVATQFRAAMDAIFAPTQAAKNAAQEYGIVLGDAARDGRNFAEISRDIFEAVDGSTEKLRELIPSVEAVSLIVAAATSQYDDFNEKLNNLEDSEAAQAAFNEALQQMMQASSTQFEIAGNNFDSLKNKIGENTSGIALFFSRMAVDAGRGFELLASFGEKSGELMRATAVAAISAIGRTVQEGINIALESLENFLNQGADFVGQFEKLEGVADKLRVSFGRVDIVSESVGDTWGGLKNTFSETTSEFGRNVVTILGDQRALEREFVSNKLAQALEDLQSQFDDLGDGAGGASGKADELKETLSQLNEVIEGEGDKLDDVQKRLRDYNRETADLDFTNQQTFERIMDMLEDTGLSLEDFGFTYDTVIEDVRSALDTLESEHESAASKIGKEIDGIIDDIAKLREAFTEEEATAETGFIEDAAKLVIEAEEKKKELAQDLVKLFVETPTEQLKSFDFTTRKKEIEDAIAEQEAIIARSGQLQVDIEGEVTKQRELADMDALSRLEFLYNEEKTKREAAFQEELTQLETRKMELESQLQEETTLYETQKAELTAIEEGFTDTYIANLQTRESATITSIQTLIQAYNELAAAAQAAGVGGVTATAEAPAPVGAGFAQGGFTGAGNPSQVAGVVHKGEYVAPARQVAAMPAVFKALDGLRGQPNTANTAPVDNSRKFEFNIENHGKEAADFYSQIDRLKWYMRYSA